jgi:hypothetical protein
MFGFVELISSEKSLAIAGQYTEYFWQSFSRGGEHPKNLFFYELEVDKTETFGIINSYPAS